MIKLFTFAFLCQFTILTTVNAWHSTPDHHDEVTLRLLDKNSPEFVVVLKKTEQLLANENLPVWFVYGNESGTLHPDTKYGTIEMRFVIESLPLEATKELITVNARRTNWVIRRPLFMYYHNKTPLSTEIKTISTKGSSKKTDETLSTIRTRRDLSDNVPDVVYIEVLLFVNHDVLDTLSTTYRSELYTTLISNLLTQFNSVDMLFSKVTQPNIKLNIAGIVIGTDSDSFPSFPRCQGRGTKKTGGFYDYFDPMCIAPALESYIRKQSGVIPPDSYDIVILLTSYHLQEKKFISFGNVEDAWGVTMVGPDSVYKTKRNRQTTVPVITVKNVEDFGSFATIAHEITHALRYRIHDEQPYADKNKNCCGYIMRPGGGHCARCLSWSPATRNHFKQFFSSPERCFFLNKPRSLERPGPREIWTADQQCQCYGFKSAGSPRKSLLQMVCGVSRIEMCDNRLNCFDNDDKSYEAPFPMDGTQCNADKSLIKKVCWNRECVPVPEDISKIENNVETIS